MLSPHAALRITPPPTPLEGVTLLPPTGAAAVAAGPVQAAAR
jgi:hypothetical protein